MVVSIVWQFNLIIPKILWMLHNEYAMKTVVDYNYGLLHLISFQTTNLRNVFVGYGYQNKWSTVCLTQNNIVVPGTIEHKYISYPYTGFYYIGFFFDFYFINICVQHPNLVFHIGSFSNSFLMRLRLLWDIITLYNAYENANMRSSMACWILFQLNQCFSRSIFYSLIIKNNCL